MNRRSRSTGPWWLLALSLALPTSTASAAGGAPDEETIGRIEAHIQDLMDRGELVGLSVSIYHQQQPVLEKGYGLANLEWDRKVTPDTVFEIGSITKTFTAMSIAQLAEAGKLSLDNTLGQHIPQAPEAIRGLTLRRLLDHTSGLGSFTSDPGFPGFRLNPYLTLDEVRDFILSSTPVLFKPGDAWSYSNSGTWLLSYIVEKAGGMPYGEYLEKNIFQPLGMSRTRLNDRGRIIENRAAGYSKTESGIENVAVHEPVVVPYGAGAVVSTSGDLQRYLSGLQASPKISSFVRESMLGNRRLNDGRTIFYTTGCLGHSSFHGHQQYMHNGGILGFSSHYAYYPDDELGIVVLTNTSGGAVTDLERRIAEIIFDIGPEPEPREIPPEDVSRLVGEYRLSEQCDVFCDFSITGSEAQLQLKLGGALLASLPGMPLRSLGGNRIVATTPAFSIVLELGSDGSQGVVSIDGRTYTVERAHHQ